jgi:hypothetical protein
MAFIGMPSTLPKEATRRLVESFREVRAEALEDALKMAERNVRGFPQDLLCAIGDIRDLKDAG